MSGVRIPVRVRTSGADVAEPIRRWWVVAGDEVDEGAKGRDPGDEMLWKVHVLQFLDEEYERANEVPGVRGLAHGLRGIEDPDPQASGARRSPSHADMARWTGVASTMSSNTYRLPWSRCQYSLVRSGR
jgi:hypothetical protein